MSKYSKFIASIVGGILGAAVAKFGFPAELASDAVVNTISTIVVSGLATYLAPANSV